MCTTVRKKNVGKKKNRKKLDLYENIKSYDLYTIDTKFPEVSKKNIYTCNVFFRFVNVKVRNKHMKA